MQDQAVDLSEEEVRELTFGLLRDWWITATQAFVDHAGSSVAIEALRPYFINNGRVGSQVYIREFGESSRTLEDVVKSTFFWLSRRSGSHSSRLTAKLFEKAASCEFVGCDTHGRSREVCICCNTVGAGNIEGVNPRYFGVMRRCLSQGDKSCYWEIGPIDSPMSLKGEPRLLEEWLPVEEQEFWRLAIFGEYWTIVTQGFIDSAGTEAAMTQLRAHLRQSGLSLGTRLAARLDQSSSDSRTLGDLVAKLGSMHQRKGVYSGDGDSYEARIAECPFSGGTSAICHQYEAFFKGLCEAINPSYEFLYDRMMTRGDKDCHWSIRRKGGPDGKKDPGESSPGDPRNILATRYARGEITKEELEERLRGLKDMGLV